MSLFSRVFNKPTQVSLVREGQTFFLRFFYDNHAATYAEVREKWQELGALDRFIDDSRQNSAAIKLSAVDSLKAVMRELRNQYASQNKLSFYISADVEAALMGETAPDGFAVKYIREGDSLRRCLPDGTVVLHAGDGSVVGGDADEGHAGLGGVVQQAGVADLAGDVPPAGVHAALAGSGPCPQAPAAGDRRVRTLRDLRRYHAGEA